MKTKVLFTAALMAAAASGAQAASYTESNMLLQLLESQRYEGVSLLADEVAEGQTDISGMVLKNAKMPTVIGNWNVNLGWLTDTSGGNFQIYAMPNPANADVDRGACPEPNAVERWNGNGHHWSENTNIIYQTTNVPNGTYTLTMWAESQALADHTHKGGMYLFANEVQTEITNHCVMQQYSLVVEVTDGTLTLGVKTGANGSDDNHVVLSAVSLLADNALLEAVSSENPFNVTSVTNAACTVEGGWTREASNASRYFVVNDNRLNSEDYTGAGIEYWTPYNDITTNSDLIYQDINGLPNGSYRITAVAMGRNTGESNNEDVHAEGLYLFANDGQAEVTTNVWGTVTATGLVTDGTLRIGLRAGENNGNNWVAMSNVKLEYLGEDMSALQDALNAKVEEAHALATTLEGQVPTTYLTQLTEVTAPACSTADEYNAAIAEIDALMAEVNAAHTVFANAFLSATNYAGQMLVAFPGAEESAKSALNSAVEIATTAALASTDATVWATQAEAVRAAAKTYFDATDKVMAEGVSNFDVTQLFMVNPGFDNAEDPLTGWTRSYDPYRIDLGMPYYDNNFGNLDFYQEITLPNGVYTASVQAQAGIGGRVNFYATSSEANSEVGLREIMGWMQDGETKYAEVAPIWAADAESGRFTTGNVFVVDGKLKVGVKTVAAAHGNLYLFFDNFRLTLVNDGAAEIKALYDGLKAEADTFDTAALPTVFAEALADALALPVETTAQYYTAYSALSVALADCKTVQEAAASLPALITECQAYLDNSEGGDEARAALENALEAVKGYMNLTTAEEIVACEAALETARQEFAKVATPTGDQQFDMTFLVKNPDANGLVRAAVSDYGWVSCTNSLANNFANGKGNNIAEFYESYQIGAFAAGTWVLWQTVNLPAGSYEMTLRAFGENANGAGSGPLVASVYAGNVKGDAVASTEEVGLENKNEKLNGVYGVSFFNATTSDVQLGVMTEEGNGANWVGCNDMKLYKVAPVAEKLALDETQAYAVAADTYANVTMQRTLEAGHWNTFCVPFDMTPEQLDLNGISEVRTFSGVTTQGEGVTLQTTAVNDGVKAGMPYIVKVNANVDEITVDGVAVTAAAPVAQRIGFSGEAFVDITGNYSAGTVPTGAFFISDDMFYVADQAVTLNGFRAYLTLVDDAGAPAQSNVNRMFIDIDGTVTGIGDVLGTEAADADKLVDVYTVGGVQVKRNVKKGEALNGLQKGVYVIDGKTYLK